MQSDIATFKSFWSLKVLDPIDFPNKDIKKMKYSLAYQKVIHVWNYTSKWTMPLICTCWLCPHNVPVFIFSIFVSLK